jgi:flavin-dependent dehydrogenase
VEKTLSSGATITASDAARSTWDAVVIGAGPAGSIAARHLARQSKSVLLVERQSWPRAKTCGGCLNQRALAHLYSLGLSDAVEASCGKPVYQLELRSSRQQFELPLPTGVAIRRCPFDAALVRHAIDAGVTFLPHTTAHVSVVRDGGDVRHIELQTSDHPPLEVRAKVAVAADGLGHPSLCRLSEFRSVAQVGGRIGFAVELNEAPPWLSDGTIVMAIAPVGYVGLVATSGGRANVAAAIWPRFVKSSRGATQIVNDILRHSGLGQLPVAANTAWRGTPRLTRASARLIHERVFVLGDAAGYVEPFTGEGMAWAIESAMWSAPWIVESMDKWDQTTAMRWDYELRRRIQRNQFVCRAVAGLLRRPRVVRTALRVMRLFPSIVQPWVRRVHAFTR